MNRFDISMRANEWLRTRNIQYAGADIDSSKTKVKYYFHPEAKYPHLIEVMQELYREYSKYVDPISVELLFDKEARSYRIIVDAITKEELKVQRVVQHIGCDNK